MRRGTLLYLLRSHPDTQEPRQSHGRRSAFLRSCGDCQQAPDRAEPPPLTHSVRSVVNFVATHRAASLSANMLECDQTVRHTVMCYSLLG